MASNSQRRRRAVRAAAPAAGLLAAGLLVWQGSTAAFTSTTNTAANNWTAGQVNLTNNSNGSATFNQTGAAAFSVNNIKPNDSGFRCITVRSTSTVAANARFYVSALSGSLAPALTLTVQSAPLTGGTSVAADCTGAPGTLTSVYSGALSAAPSSWLAAGVANQWSIAGTPTEDQLYKISWSFPTTANDNTYQGTSASAVFNWEADTP
jgi:hypothetical protein